MSRNGFSLLGESEIVSLHEASLGILRDTGVLVRHPEVVRKRA